MKNSEVSEKTLVPISLVLVIIGGASWLTTIYSEVKTVQGVLTEYTGNLQKIDQRLSRIEGRLGVNLGAMNDR